jgi:hypothetical protein
MRMRFALPLLALLVLPGAARAQAPVPWWQPTEFRVGFAAHDAISQREKGAAFDGEIFWQPLVRAFDGSVAFKPSIGGSASLSGKTSYGFVDLTGEYWALPWLYLDLGGGVAVHDGFADNPPPGRKDLGSRVLFHVAADVGVKLAPQFGVSLYFDHLSNGGLARHNEGLETLGLRAAFWF